MPWRKQTVTCKATSTSLSSLSRGAVPFSSSLTIFSLTVLSPFGVGGEEPDAKALSPGGGTPVFPPETTQEPHFHSSSQPSSRRSGHTCLHSASPRSTTALAFPACCLHGEGEFPSSLSQAPSHRREPFAHRAPCLPASGQTLNWEEVILNIWGAHLRVGSRPHGAWRKWQYMQLCHFLS